MKIIDNFFSSIKMMPKTAINSVLTLVTIIVLIIISEISLRLFYPPLNSGWLWENSPRRNLAHFENESQNQFGVRGQKISYGIDDFVILLLGDSQVESATSAPNNMPEILLENYLNEKCDNPVKVFSLAVSAWGQDQQFLLLENYYNNFRADLVLIWFTPKNDFWENAFPDRNVGKKAGHLKPTFLLKDNLIEGPFYKPNTYYKHSALMHLIFKGLQNIYDSNLEELILHQWYEELPHAHDIFESSSSDAIVGSLEVDLNYYSKNLFTFSDKQNLTILTHEDFMNCRGHFAPYLSKQSPRDLYLINITGRLIEKINNLAKLNNSGMSVFYPIREDFDLITPESVAYIKSYRIPEKYFPVKLNYLEKLQKVVSRDDLITFSISGRDELCVDATDRHLNEQGNKQVMEKLGSYLIPLIERKRNSSI